LDNIENNDLVSKAAKMLLNKTYSNNHYVKEKNNNGYGEKERPWIITENTLINLSKILRYTYIKWADFKDIINSCEKGDFMFLDPPDIANLDTVNLSSRKFSYNSYRDLARILDYATCRGVRWAMITPLNSDILKLFPKNTIVSIYSTQDTSLKLLTQKSRQVLILNYDNIPL
jgi:site-specific DNA-adenine methylase